MTTKMKLVRFLHKSGLYQKGDIAAFDEETANRIIERGYGEEVKDAKRRKNAAPSKPQVRMVSSDKTQNYITK